MQIVCLVLIILFVVLGKWDCFWYYCDECGKSVIIMCTECFNSFCVIYIEGYIKEVDGVVVCSEYDEVSSSGVFFDVQFDDGGEDSNGQVRIKVIFKENLIRKRNFNIKQEEEVGVSGSKKFRKQSVGEFKKGEGKRGKSVGGNFLVVVLMFDDSDEGLDDLVIDILVVSL